MNLVECELAQILIAEQRISQIIVLREKGGERVLPIEIGIFEAMAIQRQIQGEEMIRPMTHDLLLSVIETLGARLARVVVHDLVTGDDGVGTFYGLLVLEQNGKVYEVDCRPSDAVALAVRRNTPIFVAEQIFEMLGN